MKWAEDKLGWTEDQRRRGKPVEISKDTKWLTETGKQETERWRNESARWSDATRWTSTKPPPFLLAMVHYTMGYTHDEIGAFCEDLAGLMEERASSLSLGELVSLLWRLRSAKIPTALSGRPGCNWWVFKDEVERYSRPRLTESDQRGYWAEPALPSSSVRRAQSVE